jgi:ATP-dependent DNA helicase RecG
MNRLLQGDVGSGKTIVALIAALIAIDSGFQAAIMAPTEILAEQHYGNINGYAAGLGIKVLLLTGSTKKAERTKYLADIKDGKADIIIGTHALIQGDVDFKKLGLVVVDEQHRFGVAQRAALKRKAPQTELNKAALTPDILVMTATPIPRTLSMTVFGELDVSIIDELPLGRLPITTRLMREADRQQAYALIKKELERGSQAYIVYPLVEESEELQLRDATRMHEHFVKDIFPEYKVALLHGRMKGAEKEAVMNDFKQGRTNILVSTTVIEVGVDVPNATIILIEHAERFGLAQLHQLRGRVGRGKRSSTCILLAQYTNNEDTWKRLKVIESTTDGFRIAEEDLKIRGPGDFIGTRQSGMPEFRTSDTFADLGLLRAARQDAIAFIEADPELTSPDGITIKKILSHRWKDRLELAEVG